MTDRFAALFNAARIALLALIFGAFSITAAYADVFGRLNISLVDADTGKPLPAATLILHDPTGVHGDVKEPLSSSGMVTTGLLEVHSWKLSATLTGYDPASETANVAADNTTSVEIDLAKTEQVVNIKSNLILTQPDQPANTTQRASSFISTFPVGNNPTDLKSVLATTPGFVSSTVGVAHPRGEHNQVTLYIDGAQLGGALQGKIGQIISPQIIQNADIQTGSYAPEYGSESAAIVNLELKQGPIDPFQTLTLQYGGFNTQYEEFTAGGQFGASLEPGTQGPTPKQFRYLLDISNRFTDAAVEPPQPDNQTANNHGDSQTLFGDINYVIGPKDQLSLILNSSPAHTEIANRTGLSDSFAPVGQGYGYGGARDANGDEAGVDPGSGLIGAGSEILPSQQAAGQNVYQNDDNSFTILNYRHEFTDSVTGLLSTGFSHSGLDILNSNPQSDQDLLYSNGTGSLLAQIDNSIEFSPTILRHSTETEGAGSLTIAKPKHTIKVGFSYQNQVGDEYFQLVPGSQLALDALYANTQAYNPSNPGPQFTPNGAPNGQTDALGNPVFLASTTNGAVNAQSTPVVTTHKSGFYSAEYAQDTWKESARLTVNYGARLDTYNDKETFSEYIPDGEPIADPGAQQKPVNESYLSPRVNFAYDLNSTTVYRLSYNKLFSQPPLTQGAVVGVPLKPETNDLYETSIQHQIGDTQTIKIDAYYKNIRNQIDTGLLIPYTQFGAYTTLQYQYASVHGIELSYYNNPRNNVGLGGYATLTNSHAAPGGLDQNGAPAPTINDHDQLWTINTGLDYTYRSGALVSADNYYGSGEASSSLVPVSLLNSNVLNDGERTINDQLNLKVQSAEGFLYHGSTASISIDNVFNSLSVLNFNSGFSGTRFQLGRTLLFTLTTKL
jgi:outer membrane receptor protein involved in Fe transport